MINWNRFDDARPYVGIIGFAYDDAGQFPVMKRSDKVRSAKNAWSLVSGLHEVGRTVSHQFAAECMEEVNLVTSAAPARQIGYYEAIFPEDRWHWIMLVVARPVVSSHTLKNMEPDKHSELRLITCEDLFEGEFSDPKLWTPGTFDTFCKYRLQIEGIIDGD